MARFAVIAAVSAAVLASAPSANAVVGGQPTPPGGFPFTASIQSDGQAICGGAVISPIWILTAGHCVLDDESSVPIDTLRVRIGSNDRKAGGIVHKVKFAVIHPGWRAGPEPDAALLKLRGPTALPPVGFAGPSKAGLVAKGAPVAVSGWGLRKTKAKSAPQLMRFGEMLVRGSTSCLLDDEATVKWTICAAGPNGVPDACAGDSGGPLSAVDGASGRRLIVGIVAFGGERCGDPKLPGAYTRVPALASWITERTGIQPAP